MIGALVDLGTGKCSDFGGPTDTGVGQLEGLSLVGISDLMQWNYRHLFLDPTKWDDRAGLGRNLNPQAFYIAMRFAFTSFAGRQGNILAGFTRDQVRQGVFFISANNKSVTAQAVDWGPGWDDDEGQRLVDCAPGILGALGVVTDEDVGVKFLPLS